MAGQKLMPLDYATAQNRENGCAYLLAVCLLFLMGIGVALSTCFTAICLFLGQSHYIVFTLLVVGLVLAIVGSVLLKRRFDLTGITAALMCLAAVGALLVGIWSWLAFLNI